MCVCVYVYIYIYVYVHTCIHIRMQAYMHPRRSSKARDPCRVHHATTSWTPRTQGRDAGDDTDARDFAADVCGPVGTFYA